MDRLLEKFESRHHDPLLKVRVVWRTERIPQRPIHHQPARRTDSLCDFAQQADRNSGDA